MTGKKTSKVFRILVILIMLVIVLLLVWLIFLRQKEDPMTASIRAKLGQLDGKTEEEIQAELNRVIEEGMFHIVINADPVFASGDAEGNLEIENVPNNRYDMRVEIRLEDGTQVYDSGLIYPNYHIQKDRLTQVLQKGDYPADVVFYAYDRESQTEMGSIATKVTLHINN